jgi:hypothetical protein
MEKFKVIKWPNGIQWLEVDPKLLDESILFGKINGLNHFICNFHPTDKIADLSFLEHSIVKGLNITFGGIQSNAQINQFTDLEILLSLFGSPTTVLDFSSLKKLKMLEITWNDKIQGLSSLVNLVDLQLYKYKPVSKDLSEFKKFAKMEKLKLVRPAIQSLDGIQGLDRLTELEITKPGGFNQFFKSLHSRNLLMLRHLVLSFCKEFDFGSFAVLENLNHLHISDSGKISSLKEVIMQLPNLRTLIFTGSELVDGNLDYLLDHPALERVTIDDKKHYNLKEKQIHALLEEKRSRK